MAAVGDVITAGMAARPRTERARRSFRSRLLVFVGILCAVGITAVAVVWVITPSGSDVQAKVQTEATARGVAIIPASSIPLNLSRGIVAVEDERFYRHHGIDYEGVVRSALYDAQHWCTCQGASTVTEQLVKQVYLDASDRGWSKVVDIFVAYKVEGVIGKSQIMADYVSIAPTGPGLYGMPAASCAYFGRELSQLDLAQLALLAGLPQAPTTYDPLNNPAAAMQRRADVLRLMVAERYVTKAEAAVANAEPLLPAAPPISGAC